MPKSSGTELLGHWVAASLGHQVTRELGPQTVGSRLQTCPQATWRSALGISHRVRRGCLHSMHEVRLHSALGSPLSCSRAMTPIHAPPHTISYSSPVYQCAVAPRPPYTRACACAHPLTALTPRFAYRQNVSTPLSSRYSATNAVPMMVAMNVELRFANTLYSLTPSAMLAVLLVPAPGCAAMPAPVVPRVGYAIRSYRHPGV